MLYSIYFLLLNQGHHKCAPDLAIFADYPVNLSESYILIITDEKEALQ